MPDKARVAENPRGRLLSTSPDSSTAMHDFPPSAMHNPREQETTQESSSSRAQHVVRQGEHDTAATRGGHNNPLFPGQEPERVDSSRRKKRHPHLLGLLAKSTLLTVQRVADLALIVQLGLERPTGFVLRLWLTCFGIACSTVLLGYTLACHRSNARDGQPHGLLVGAVAGIFQLCGLVEMVDKLAWPDRELAILVPREEKDSEEVQNVRHTTIISPRSRGDDVADVGAESEDRRDSRNSSSGYDGAETGGRGGGRSSAGSWAAGGRCSVPSEGDELADSEPSKFHQCRGSQGSHSPRTMSESGDELFAGGSEEMSAGSGADNLEEEHDEYHLGGVSPLVVASADSADVVALSAAGEAAGSSCSGLRGVVHQRERNSRNDASPAHQNFQKKTVSPLSSPKGFPSEDRAAPPGRLHFVPELVRQSRHAEDLGRSVEIVSDIDSGVFGVSRVEDGFVDGAATTLDDHRCLESGGGDEGIGRHREVKPGDYRGAGMATREGDEYGSPRREDAGPISGGLFLGGNNAEGGGARMVTSLSPGVFSPDPVVTSSTPAQGEEDVVVSGAGADETEKNTTSSTSRRKRNFRYLRKQHHPINDPVPRGSPGEYSMRGLRKLSIVQLPSLILSLLVNCSWFLFGEPYWAQYLLPSLAFLLALVSVAVSCADLCLYIWVDDAFVRQNKKLVTVFYLVEMWGRVPLLIMFHVQAVLACAIVFGEMFCMTALQQSAVFRRRRQGIRGRWFSATGSSAGGSSTQKALKKQCGNVLHGFIFALPLMVVNFHFFDPGLTFQYRPLFFSAACFRNIGNYSCIS